MKVVAEHWKTLDLLPGDGNVPGTGAGSGFGIRVLGGLVLACSLAWSVAAHARSAPDSFADLAEKLTPAVVNISTTQKVKAPRGGEVPMPQFPPGSPFEEFFKDFFERQRPGDDEGESQRSTRRVSSLGSGFVIDPSGIVITNNHVIADADEVTVILGDETRLPAEIVGRDVKTDIAVLRVKPEKPLTAVKFGDSSKARVGDWVVAIGNPFGLGGSVTAGIISARARNINAGPYDDFIQTDASINRGNSGGPLFNMDGEVIGINTAIYSPSGGSIGIGFAIAANLAKPVIAQLREFGETRRGWLGVRIQPVTDEIAESLALGEPKGALVASVFEKGPAEEAGIKAGDVILKFDGKDVPRVRVLPRIVAETSIGKAVAVEVWRKGEVLKLSVRIGELKDEEIAAAEAVEEQKSAPEDGIAALGMTLSSLTDDLRERFEIGDEVNGVVITEVDEDSAASEKGLRAGDVIVEVAQEVVTSPKQVVDRVASAESEKRKSVLLLVHQKAQGLRFVALRIEKS
jgi:serine protease Do